MRQSILKDNTDVKKCYKQNKMTNMKEEFRSLQLDLITPLSRLDTCTVHHWVIVKAKTYFGQPQSLRFSSVKDDDEKDDLAFICSYMFL